MTLLDGKALSLKIQEQLTAQTREMKEAGKRSPHLAAILVGSDGASQTYVGHKVKACKNIGYQSTLIRLPETISEEELLAEIKEINYNDDIDGLIVQLPLPKHISVDKVTQTIAPHKDVDGFHPVNTGRMAKNWPTYLPATPYGIIQLLEHYKVETSGKNCVVLGRSQIVGSPMSILLSRNDYPGNCTVTLCHSRTRNLEEITKKADIIVAALGIPGFLTGDMVKKGAVVIDVGITRVKDESKKSSFRLTGDVAYNEVAQKCSFITPVPGGVGPMTIAGLLQNTMLAAKGAIYQ